MAIQSQWNHAYNYTRLIIAVLLLFSTNSFAAAPTRQSTYTSGEVISSTDVTGNEDAIFNYLQAGVDTYKDLSIVNADISASANIQTPKINLTSIAQDVNITSSGSLTNGGAFTNAGAATLNGNVVLGDAIGDTLTIDAGTWTLTNATTWTLTGALTFSGTIANLGTVTTVAINGGTAVFSDTSSTFYSLPETTAPTVAASEGALYTKDTAGQPELFFREESNGDEVQITSTGSLSGPGYRFIESGTFSAVTSNSITETISSGDVYQIVWEAIGDGVGTIPIAIRINSDSSGSNYDFVVAGTSFDGTSTNAAISDNGSADNEIQLLGGADNLATAAPFTVIATITARASDTQVYWTINSMVAGGISYTARGSGVYDAGTPTSIQLLRTGGSGTFTGRNYVYKFNSS